VAPPKAVYDASDKNVTAPVVQRQDLPAWPSTPGLGTMPIRAGIVEVTIDEGGRVIRATMRAPINPAYDAMVLNAVTGWRYKPALLAGAPVKYRKMIQINVERK
jgi:hypothetical protein